jgi:hypothetical protein
LVCLSAGRQCICSLAGQQRQSSASESGVVMSDGEAWGKDP